MAKYIFAVKIYLDSTPTENTDIGLYDVAAENSQLRWIDTDIADYSPTLTWKDKILIQGGIGKIQESVDLRTGGNVAQVGGMTIRVGNTLDISGTFTQLDKTLEAASIKLTGLKCEVLRFEISNNALVDAGGTIIWSGACDDVSWTERVFNIQANTMQIKRNANLTDEAEVTGTDERVVIPVTLGKFEDRYAKLLRTNKSKAYKNNKYLWGYSNVSPEKSAFPIVGTSDAAPSLKYLVKMANTNGSIPADVPAGTNIIMEVVGGVGMGQMRAVATLAGYTGGDYTIDDCIMEATIEQYFHTSLEGNVDGSYSDSDGNENSWVAFIEYGREYKLDQWNCKAFLDEDESDSSYDEITLGNESNVNLLAYKEKKTVDTTTSEEDSRVIEEEADFRKLQQKSYKISSVNNNNKIELSAVNVEQNLDELVSTRILYTTFDKFIDDANLNDWFMSQDSSIDGAFPGVKIKLRSFERLISKDTGVYGFGAGFVSTMESTAYWAGQKYTFPLDSGDAGDYDMIFAIQYALPDLPKNFDKMYLGITGGFSGGLEADEFYLKMKRFFGGGASLINDQTGLDDYTAVSYNTISNDQNFYVHTDDTSPSVSKTGYRTFKFKPIDTLLYGEMDKIGVFWRTHGTWGGGTLQFVAGQNASIAIILENIENIAVEIFTSVSGRVFDDTWGARRTATDLIEKPGDVLEHILRLQNWSEVGENKNWGKAYATAPLIDTSSNEGGFDYEDIASINNMRVARQIHTKSDAETRNLVKNICQQFFLGVRQDPATGKEQVANIATKSITAPTTTIDLSDIIGPIQRVDHPMGRYVYSEPFVRYKKNYATGEFDKIIRVTNSGQASYSSDYVEGLSGDTAELVWTRCNKLWQVTRTLELPPKALTDHEWIYRDEDAIQYLDTWLSYMGALNTDGTPGGVVFEPKKRFSFSVPYDTGKNWSVLQHHKIQLPHQTNSQAIEFVIEKTNKSIAPGQEGVEIQVMLYGDASEIEVYVQASMVNGTELDDWQCHMSTFAGRGEGGDDIQIIK